MEDKYYAYLLNVDPNDLVFLKMYKTEFDETIITFTNQNNIPLEIERKVDLTLFIKKCKMQRYSIEPRRGNYVIGYGFLSFERNYKKQLLDRGLDSLKAASKKVVHKAGEFLGNKIADAVILRNKNLLTK